ncbi:MULTISPECIES: motility associated factor glycosyltransferase family protein [Thermoanaerobacterium]|uniref:Motility associated factor glycosyltransferase family protein n=2 Tax=Thermoanaerobacterium TaxID=28895 RepID=W9E7P9_9THEO|nr:MULTISPECIES: 6-hydroxymethylpterin diphosphokinase MptE-like protein [Thermoanaerobacterium]AFK87668.1 protein of unknown function DUF115 [Thermoanaerobacterium saccharolyticum JW/SL-YS485]ETO37603.1 hypothetical protein V518_2295 [Thermoanaerobacterium aotearoense SCUT27]
MNSFEILKAKDEFSTLVYKVGDKKVFLHSSYFPDKEAKEWANNIDFDDEAILIIYGVGLGYHINYLLERISFSNRLILVEPSREIFNFAFDNGFYDEFKDMENVYFILDETEENLKTLLSSYIPWDNFENVVYKEFKQYSIVFKEHYNRFNECLLETVNSMRINRNTALYFAEQWQSNFMENLEFVFKSVPVKSFFDTFKNIPAIIVSAGPSLDKNIKLLKEIKNKCIIICVGTALKALIKENIVPDFIVSIDGSEKNFKHFEGYVTDVPLLYDLTIYPEILRKHKGHLIIGNIASGFSDLLEERLSTKFGDIVAGPSVANVSLDFAYKLGCDPIIFIGQDLAYLNDRTHASGTTYENDRIKKDSIEKEYIYVKGNYEDNIITDRVFLSFKTWFENYIYSHLDRTYINSTEGGAYIKGTKVEKLEDVIKHYMKNDLNLTDIINDILTNQKIKPKESKINSLKYEFENSIKNLEKIKNDCIRGAKLSKKMYNEYQKDVNADVSHIVSILDKIDKRLKNSKDSFLYISSILNIVTTKVLKGFKPEKDETEKQKKLRIAMMSYTLYQGIYEAIEKSLEGLKKALKTVDEIKR